MKKWSMIFAFGLAALLTACGGSGGGGDTEGSSSSGGAHSSVAAAAPKKAIAAAAIVLSRDFYEGMLGALGGFTAQQPAAAAPRDLPPTVACEGGGNMTYSANESAGTVNISFDQCTMETETYNGEIDIKISGGSPAAGTATVVIKHLTVTSGDETTLLNLTLTVKNGIGTVQSYDIELTGTTEVTTSESVERATYDHFHVVSSEGSTSIDGTISISSDPDACGISGTYAFQTLEPITYDRTGRITGGKLKINGDVYTFNADGTISVNGQTYSYEDIQQQCIAEGM